jgi:transcriptional regulator with XRE-family HTH domain
MESVYDFILQCGRNFRVARINKRFSQTELAKKAGVPQSILSRFESGKGNPTMRFLYKLAVALEVELDIDLKKPPSFEDVLSELLGNQNTQKEAHNGSDKGL